MSVNLPLFISYSRKNTVFVDRLEADLRAFNFDTWVDRRKLEGGDEWMEELQAAIERSQVLLLILSQDALASKWVRMEFRHALRLNKTVIPILIEALDKTPMDLQETQWVVFEGKDYDIALKELINSLVRIEPLPQIPKPDKRISIFEDPGPLDLVTARPPVSLPDPELEELYRAGLDAKSKGNLDRAAVLWQQIVERDANFYHGVIVPQFEALMTTLYPIRLARLRQRANQACKTAEWGQEIGTWDAILKLDPKDKQALQRREIALENQKRAPLYETAVAFFDQNNFVVAKEQLELLYKYAPYYGDPSQITNRLGIGEKLDFISKQEFLLDTVDRKLSNEQNKLNLAESQSKTIISTLDQKEMLKESLYHPIWRREGFIDPSFVILYIIIGILGVILLIKLLSVLIWMDSIVDVGDFLIRVVKSIVLFFLYLFPWIGVGLLVEYLKEQLKKSLNRVESEGIEKVYQEINKLNQKKHKWIHI